MLYLDFHITVLEPSQRGAPWPLRASTPAGDDRAEMTLNPAALLKAHPPSRKAISCGQALYAALFAPSIAAAWRASRDALRPDQELRLKLSIDPPEVAMLPWELLADQDGYPLASKHSVVRYLPLPQRIPPMDIALPLRVLCVISAPLGVGELDVKGETKRMQDALQPLRDRGLATVDFLEDAHFVGIQAALRKEYHVFHYIGHGTFNQRSSSTEYGLGYLALEDRDGTASWLGARLLKVLFDRSTVRLAILNGCETARLEAEPLLAIAPALLRADVPAVIAHQFEIADKSALMLTDLLYTGLAHGDPVDLCVSEARRALMGTVGLDAADWATPALWMRGDGILFSPEAATRSGHPHDDTLAHMDDDSLLDLLATHRENLAIGKQQAAGYDATPLHVLRLIARSHNEVETIMVELARRGLPRPLLSHTP